MEKLMMYVYSDLKTDARVMRSIEALKETYDLTVLATNSEKNFNAEGFEFIDVIDSRKTNPLVRYLSSLRSALKLVNQRSPDIIYAHDYYAAPWVLLKMSGRKSIYDAHEIFCLNKPSTKREKITGFLERRAIEKVDRVICACESRKMLMTQSLQTKREIVSINNVSILPRVVSEDQILNIHSDLDKFLSDHRRTVVYCGALIRARRIDLLIGAAQELSDRIKVLIVGAGEEKERIAKLVKDYAIGNVYMLNAVPYRLIYSVISKCDIGYLHYENDTLNNTYCAPNKIYEYASAQLPVVGNCNVGLSSVIEKYSIGVVDDNLTAAISKVIDGYDSYKDNLATFLQDSSWDIEKKKLVSAVTEI